MADATLSFSVAGVTPKQLEVLVKNTGAELKRPLLIELKLPLDLVSKDIADAVDRARQRNLDERTTASKESLGTFVTGPTGWSAWAATERTEPLAVIRLFNDLDPTGAKLASPVSFAAGAQFKLIIPFTPQQKAFHIDIPYSYRYPNEGRSGVQVSDELHGDSSGSNLTSKVTLELAHPNPTQIKPESKVRLSWEVENGVSATLYGPLPGGNSKISLNTRESGTYKMRKDSIDIYAVGSATYILQAVVKGSTGDNELVVRTVYLGIQSTDDYAFLGVRPKRVMPHGLLELDWAVWGIEKAWLSVGNDYEIELTLTEQGVSETFQGSGVWRVVAPAVDGTVTALLQSQVNTKRRDEKTENFMVAAWRPRELSVTGDPVGVAVTAPKMALLTTNGLWLADVGVSDGSTDDTFLEFKKVSGGNPKARLEVAAFGDGFVVLEQTNNDGLQLVRYTLNGQRDTLAVDLPDTVKPLVRMSGRTFDLAVLGERVYVAVEGFDPDGYRKVFSVTFKPQARIQPEPLLETLSGYRLIVFDNALFALNQGTGHMFRFQLNSKGNLERIAEAARAAKDGRSMIFRGLLVPAGKVLVVLGATSAPQIEPLDVSGLLTYALKKQPTERMTQDLVYNPQQDHWMPCGRGLQIQPCSVVAFRATASRRLWVVESNTKAYTLSGAFEHLFSTEFVADIPSKELPPYFGKRKYTLKNDTGNPFMQMDEVYRKAGFEDFRAWGPVEPYVVPKEIIMGGTETFEFHCSETEPAPIKLRYMAYMPAGVAHDYMLELEFQGPGHSIITSVVKQLTIDDQGKISVVEIAGTATKHAPGKTIVLPPVKLFFDEVNLNINRLSGYIFGLKRRLIGESNEYPLGRSLKINCETPAFNIFVAGAGELRFDVDFTLPHGIEISSHRVKQTRLIRIDPEKAGVLSIEASYKEPNSYDCSIRYLEKLDLDGAYIGDAVATNDGKSIYIPLLAPKFISSVTVKQIDVASLVPVASFSSHSQGIFTTFSVPNSIGLLNDSVVGMFGANRLLVRHHTLQDKATMTVVGPTAIIAMAVGGDRIGLLCLKEERVNQNTKYSYTYSRKKIALDKLIDDGDYSLDTVFWVNIDNRLVGGPNWVSSASITPMAISPDGELAAICIDRGVLWIHTPARAQAEVKAFPINGTGRAEAIIVDSSKEIYCAHSRPDNQGLIVTRINPSDPLANISVPLPGAVSHMVTDTRPLKIPALQYKRHPAVSLFRYSVSGLCVSHGRTIYSLNTNEMKVGSSATVDLPCRLIRVKIDRAPHATHPVTGAAPCLIVYAIGATYTGEGSVAGKFKTELYKLGFD